jgi:hypothetical protein
MLRDTANAWVRKNCPNPALQKEFLRHFDAATNEGFDGLFMIGAANTTSCKPLLVHFHAGEQFVFVPSNQPARNLDVATQQSGGRDD